MGSKLISHLSVSVQCAVKIAAFNLPAAASIGSRVCKNCPQLKRNTSSKFMFLSQGQLPSNDETRRGSQRILEPWSQDQRTLKSELAQHFSQNWLRPLLHSHDGSNSPQPNHDPLTSDRCSPTAFPIQPSACKYQSVSWGI